MVFFEGAGEDAGDDAGLRPCTPAGAVLLHLMANEAVELVRIYSECREYSRHGNCLAILWARILAPEAQVERKMGGCVRTNLSPGSDAVHGGSGASAPEHNLNKTGV